MIIYEANVLLGFFWIQFRISLAHKSSFNPIWDVDMQRYLSKGKMLLCDSWAHADVRSRHALCVHTNTWVCNMKHVTSANSESLGNNFTFCFLLLSRITLANLGVCLKLVWSPDCVFFLPRLTNTLLLLRGKPKLWKQDPSWNKL